MCLNGGPYCVHLQLFHDNDKKKNYQWWLFYMVVREVILSWYSPTKAGIIIVPTLAIKETEE